MGRECNLFIYTWLQRTAVIVLSAGRAPSLSLALSPRRTSSSILYGDVAPNAKLSFVRRWLLPVKIDGRGGGEGGRKRRKERRERGNKARMSLYAERKRGYDWSGCFRTSVRFILRVESSRVGSLDKRTKGQLFGGGKDSWSNRPRRRETRRDGTKWLFSADCSPIKNRIPAKLRERLFESTIGCLRIFRSFFPTVTVCPLCVHGVSIARARETPSQKAVAGTTIEGMGRNARCIRAGIYKYRSRYLSRDVIVHADQRENQIGRT